MIVAAELLLGSQLFLDLQLRVDHHQLRQDLSPAPKKILLEFQKIVVVDAVGLPYRHRLNSVRTPPQSK